MTGASPLHGRTAVVTGAARGVGEQVALALARRGARVAVVGHEEAELARVAAGCRAAGGAAHPWPADVTDERRMTAVAREIGARLGPVSVVVANAGIVAGGPFDRMDPAVWRRIVEVNLMGSAVTARVLLPALLATHGYYLQISSLAGFAPSPMMSAYAASKAGAEAFAYALRAEVAHRGVAVGVARLTWHDTEMIRGAEEHRVMRELRHHLPWPMSRVYALDGVGERLARGIERRRPLIGLPPWIGAVGAARPLLPRLVTHRARHILSRLDEDALAPTGLLGRGGAADRERPA
ncbi:SDR family oxidoreductase [Streptomyces sp. ISL-36]|uniref:SDR family oxidoreductase n=1 Tax=Streptomyces sp. ISL-36 TaxID=2819182 RepID=UPI001BEAF889|nr:SDR family oxidoreductase [Streptomyces sp. ISL-36]MBT2439881.1 SDR family oxidoreductase [Streptomyces sp. ISL-36]